MTTQTADLAEPADSARAVGLPRTFSIQTLGCKVNQYEAEQLAILLRARGLVPAADGVPADLRLVHTCSVTVQAASKSRQAVRQTVVAGRDRPASPSSGPPAAGRSLPVLAVPALSPPSPATPLQTGPATPGRVVVTGCWATGDPAAARAIPGVDAVLTHHGDVAAELDALLSAWAADGHATGPAKSAEPDLAQFRLLGDFEDASAGTPAGPFTRVSKLPSDEGVNAKITPGSTRQTFDGSRRLAADATPAKPTGKAVGPAPFAGMSSLPLLHDHQTGRQRALLKVQDGCDAHCTYCIIPTLRPGVRSKPVDDAVAEARNLVAGGHVELVLTGIFLGAYGQETALRRRQGMKRGGEGESGGGGAEGGRRPPQERILPPSPPLPLPPSLRRPTPHEHTPLASLVVALCTGVPGLRRLRLSSLEPGDLTDDLLAVLRAHPQVVPHFHLPLQSGSDAILRRMNRQYGRDDFRRMLDRVRSAFDRPALTTDVIVGFPGETDAEFDRTMEVVDAAGFIHVHAFGFSPRPGTAAARWQRDFVRGPVVNERIAALRESADRHSLTFRRSFVGRTVELLVEREKETDRTAAAAAGATASAGTAEGVTAGAGLRHGRSERYFPVWFDDPTARPGDFARVRVDAVTPTRTHGMRVG